MVDLAVTRFGGGPALPTVGLLQNERIRLPFQCGLCCLVLLQAVQIFQEQQPGGLFRVVQLTGATGFFAEGIVDVPEGLFKHGFILFLELLRFYFTGELRSCDAWPHMACTG